MGTIISKSEVLNGRQMAWSTCGYWFNTHIWLLPHSKFISGYFVTLDKIFFNEFSHLEFFYQCPFSFSPIFRVEFFMPIFRPEIFCWFRFFPLLFQSLNILGLFFDQSSDLKFYHQLLKFFPSIFRFNYSENGWKYLE